MASMAMLNNQRVYIYIIYVYVYIHGFYLPMMFVAFPSGMDVLTVAAMIYFCGFTGTARKKWQWGFHGKRMDISLSSI